MEILFSCLSNSWGGMEMLTIIQMQQLVERNIAVELLCLKDSKMQKEAEKKGLKCFTINSANSVNPSGITKVMSFLKSRDFDLVHAHASGDLWTVVPALKISRNKIPLILTKHVGSYIVKKDFLHKRVYNRVNIALAISSVIKSNLLETTPLSEEKIILIHNGIDVNKFDPSKADREKVRSEYKIVKDEVVIGMMGRFSPGKGHEEFLNAAKKLNLKHQNLRFIIVGEASYKEEEYYEKIRILSDDLGLNNIIFTGYVSDTKNILAAMDIFIFPSHAESFGLALTEAMAMELPSVSSDSDGVLDITVDNETGFLFKNKNAEDLSEKISKLILSKDLREKFGKAARLRVIDKFNLSKQTDKIVKIYSEQI